MSVGLILDGVYGRNTFQKSRKANQNFRLCQGSTSIGSERFVAGRIVAGRFVTEHNAVLARP